MKKIRLCALMLASAILALSLTATSTVAATESTRSLPVIWTYPGDTAGETVVTIPDSADILMPGTFSGSNVTTIIISHDMMLCGNAFYGAYQLTDIYFYADNVTHLYDLYNGKPCKHGELVCMDESCMHRYEEPVYTTFLCGTYVKPERYASPMLTIHGHKGSTAEHFVEVVNNNPTLFNCPQELVFQVIENESEKPEVEEGSEEGVETPKEDAQEPPTSDDNAEEGTDKGDAEESPEKPPEEPERGVHLKGTPGTELYIDNFNGITYPRRVYMNVGSYYVLELGNVPEGCTYQIPEVHSSRYTLDVQTGKISALCSGVTTIKIRLTYPDGRYANLSCTIYIKGD